MLHQQYLRAVRQCKSVQDECVIRNVGYSVLGKSRDKETTDLQISQITDITEHAKYMLRSLKKKLDSIHWQASERDSKI